MVARPDGASPGRRHPPEVRPVLDSILEGLSEEQLKVLKRSALAGRFLTLSLLSHLTGMEELTLAEILDDFVGSGLLLDDGQGYQFKFGVMRSYLVSLISPSLRSILHERTAAALELMGDELFGELLTETARHYCCSRNTEKALPSPEWPAGQTFREASIPSPFTGTGNTLNGFRRTPIPRSFLCPPEHGEPSSP